MDWPTVLPSNLHATALNCSGIGVLIVGPSGAGKSSLAFQMIALGASLISDDLCKLAIQENGGIAVSCPIEHDGTLGLEARGIGIIPVQAGASAQLGLVVDLSHSETTRMPEKQTVEIATVRIPLLHNVENSAFPAMIMQYVNNCSMR